LRRVTTPDGPSGVFRINFRQKDEINRRHPYATAWIDRWSGQTKEVRTPAKFNVGETLITWMWPLHTGEAVGKFGRLCWFLAGQSLFFLYLSGIYRWLCRTGKLKDISVPAMLQGLPFNCLLLMIAPISRINNYFQANLAWVYLSKIIRNSLQQGVTEIFKAYLFLINAMTPVLQTGFNRLLPLGHKLLICLMSRARRFLAYTQVKMKLR